MLIWYNKRTFGHHFCLIYFRLLLKHVNLKVWIILLILNEFSNLSDCKMGVCKLCQVEEKLETGFSLMWFNGSLNQMSPPMSLVYPAQSLAKDLILFNSLVNGIFENKRLRKVWPFVENNFGTLLLQIERKRNLIKCFYQRIMVKYMRIVQIKDTNYNCS